MPTDPDHRWLDAAARLAARGVPLSRPNPAVGALVVRHGIVIAQGWTRPGGRPHAEAVALQAAGSAARGATLYVTLEPCAHQSARGPACADLIAASALARVVVGCADPDPRTAGQGLARIRAAGIAAELAENADCAASLAGYLMVQRQGRPHLTLKLALSKDARLSPPPGEGQWLTGAVARRHVHALRARMDAIVVGRGTLDADRPRLDVRLPGIGNRSPDRWLLSRGAAPDGWRLLSRPGDIADMAGVQTLMVEGGAGAAQSFLMAGLIDRLMIYRAPGAVGGAGPALPGLTTAALAAAPRWTLTDTRKLGNDQLEVYERS